MKTEQRNKNERRNGIEKVNEREIEKLSYFAKNEGGKKEKKREKIRFSEFVSENTHHKKKSILVYSHHLSQRLFLSDGRV